MITITKEFLFDSAHRLYRQDLTPEENREIYGKCYSLHGHTYRLLVTVSGEINPYGMVINFADLKKVVKAEIIDRYDHAFLNDLEEFKNIPTTAENMVQYMFPILAEKLTEWNVTLESITLYETPTSCATISK